MKDYVAPILEDLRKVREELEALRAENATLIAERDMLKLCADHNEDEVKKLLAERKEYLANKVLDASDRKLVDRILEEREQWMKQEPYGYVHPEDEWSLRNKGVFISCCTKARG